MKYDAPTTAASVARGITRSDVRKILTGLPRENILLRESARCERAARGIYRPYYYASARRVGHPLEKCFALTQKPVRADRENRENRIAAIVYLIPLFR